VRCPWCHERLQPEAASRCEACGTAAHAECAAEHGGCAIPACARQAPRVPGPALVRPPRQPRSALRGPLGGFLVTVLLGLSLFGGALRSPEPLFVPRLRQREVAPDGRHEVLLWSRLAWPPRESDPRLVVFMEVRQRIDLDGSVVVDRRSFELPQASRLRPARVVWGHDRVDVEEYDRDTVGRVQLRRPIVR
jgi:hypothetical protein